MGEMLPNPVSDTTNPLNDLVLGLQTRDELDHRSGHPAGHE
jgi:hypothetical protein